MAAPDRVYRGQSADARAGERRARLLNAALAVLGRDDGPTLTVDNECAHAGLTKRYFYESFADRDELLLAALEDLFTTLADRVVAIAATAGARRRRARAVVDLLVDTLADDPGLARLYVLSAANDVLRARRDAAVDQFTTIIARDVLDFGGSRPRGVDRMIAVRLLVSGTTELVTGWLDGTITCSRGRLVDTVVALGQAMADRL